MRHYAGSRKILSFLLAAAVVSALTLCYAYRCFYRSAYPLKYTGAVISGSELNALPQSLVYAVIRTESGFKPDARSSVGAVGLMQITSDTFNWTLYRLKEESRPFDDLLDSDTNIRYGSALLRLLMDEFGSIENALCAYHAGWGSAKEWLADPSISADGVNIEDIPFDDTRKYVKKVLSTKKIYEKLYKL